MSSRAPSVSHSLLTDDVPPRHQSLARTLASEIERGVYPVGTKLPRELDLCEAFGASRHTVRVALDRLVRLGLISRKPRIGTIVKARRPQQGYRLKVDKISDLAVFGASTAMRVLERSVERLDEGAEEALQRYVGQQWLLVKGLRRSDDQAAPISYHEVWVHPDYRAVTGVEGVVKRSIVVMVEEQFGVSASRVRQSISSALATNEIESLLEVEAGTPCLWVRREYCDRDGNLIQLSISVHPGELFAYEMELERSHADSDVS